MEICQISKQSPGILCFLPLFYLGSFMKEHCLLGLLRLQTIQRLGFFFKFLVKIIKNLKKTHIKISQTQSLYISMNFNTTAIAILKLWSFTLDFTFSLSNIYIYTHKLPKEKNPQQKQSWTWKEVSFISCFSSCPWELHSVLPHVLRLTLSCSLFYILYCTYMCICLNIYIYMHVYHTYMIS